MTSAVQTTYSVKVNTAIDEYNKHIGALARTYGSIEGAKGHWHVRWDNYKAGKFPPTAQELDKTLDKELDTYESLAKATEQSKTLLTLFRNTIEYCTRHRISAYDYETLERRGYKTTPSIEGEDVLPQICTHLENLYERIEIIKLHMTDRLPKAAVNLNGVFHEVFNHRQETTWADTARNVVFNNYLEKAREKKRSSETAALTDSSATSTESRSVCGTTPEEELASLGEVLATLQVLSGKDPLTELSNQDKALPSGDGSDVTESKTRKGENISPDLNKSILEESSAPTSPAVTSLTTAQSKPSVWNQPNVTSQKKNQGTGGKDRPAQ
jgi:hypothetical protein